jgi:5'(3')-deoxyribonucleotidase
VVFTSHKELLADDDSCLIDDDEKNIKAFREAGGNALLFPQPWNGHETPLNPVRYVLDWLEETTC